MFTDYEYYLNEYCGDKAEDIYEFKRKVRDAEQKVRRFTLGRVDHITDEDLMDRVKYTVCKLIDYSFNVDESNAQGMISSEKIGDYSVSYSKVDSQETANKEYSIIYENLIDTGLLYRGVSTRRF